MRYIVNTVPEVATSTDLGVSTQRKQWVSDLKVCVPSLEVQESINGFNPKIVDDAVVSSGLKFRGLYFSNYGTLASWLSKYNCIKDQVETATDFMCFMEDDFSVTPEFPNLVEWAAQRFFVQPDLNYITFATYSECYLTSLDGARRLMDIFSKDGIKDNFDNQMTRYEPWVRVSVPHRILSMANGGAIRLTDSLPHDYSFQVSFSQGARSVSGSSKTHSKRPAAPEK